MYRLPPTYRLAANPTPMPTHPAPRVSPRFFTSVAVAALLLVAAVRGIAAHDFWIVPTSFDIPAGAMLELRGQTGVAFPQSVSAVAAERIADARVLGAASDERLTDFSASGKSLMITHRPSAAGQRVVAVALVPRVTPQSGPGFERYLRLEGATLIADRYQREGRLPKDSVRMRVTKTAKTVVEVGTGGPRAHGRTVGHRLEIVPTSDVVQARSGGSVALRVLFAGQPLANATLVASSAPSGSAWEAPPAPPGEAPATADHPHEIQLTTDAAGTATLALNADGLWNVRAANAVPSAPGSGAEWDVHFATLVFGAGGSARATSAPAAAPAGSDSAAAAATVASFHAALAAGDSLRALSYLDPGVVILESGGVEDMREYRSHHLASDIAFAKAVASSSGPTRVTVRGDVAWASSTSTTTGTFRGRAVNSSGAELMVLVRGAAGWRISAIHWSSRTRR